MRVQLEIEFQTIISFSLNKNHVRMLWAKIAGKRHERLVRDLEQKVFMAWSRDSLESDYVPKVVQ